MAPQKQPGASSKPIMTHAIFATGLSRRRIASGFDMIVLQS
jgi:hypothetical protein